MKSQTKLTLLIFSLLTTLTTLQIANATPAYRIHQPACLITMDRGESRGEARVTVTKNSAHRASTNAPCTTLR